jgi:hypothetical protein
MKKMRIRITNEGRTEIKVEGGEGGDCLEFTSAMEGALGQVEQRELTEDYDKESVQVFEQEIEGTGL